MRRRGPRARSQRVAGIAARPWRSRRSSGTINEVGRGERRTPQAPGRGTLRRRWWRRWRLAGGAAQGGPVDGDGVALVREPLGPTVQGAMFVAPPSRSGSERSGSFEEQANDPDLQAQLEEHVTRSTTTSFAAQWKRSGWRTLPASTHSRREASTASRQLRARDPPLIGDAHRPSLESCCGFDRSSRKCAP